MRGKKRKRDAERAREGGIKSKIEYQEETGGEIEREREREANI